MNDREIDDLLNGERLPQSPKAETLERIAQSIAGSMLPVRPMPPKWMLAGGVALICAVVALAGAAGMGFAGFSKMTLPDRALVFSTLGILVLGVASETARAMIPGSRRQFSSGGLLLLAALCLGGVFALCFRDYRNTHFVHAGLVCLAIGLLHAIPTGLLSWLVLRRGFAVDAVSAGLAAGTLAGLSGMTMLELHCPNFQAAHVLVWHLGVLLVSGGLGAGCGRLSASAAANRDTAATTTSR